MRRSEERKAGENAKAVLSRLMPETARTDRLIFILRYAANLVATGALIRGLESKKALDATREESTKVAQCGVQLVGKAASYPRRDRPS